MHVLAFETSIAQRAFQDNLQALVHVFVHVSSWELPLATSAKMQAEAALLLVFGHQTPCQDLAAAAGSEHAGNGLEEAIGVEVALKAGERPTPGAVRRLVGVATAMIIMIYMLRAVFA